MYSKFEFISSLKRKIYSIQNKGVFSEEQLKQLEKTTVSTIICQNSDNIKTIIKKSFQLPNHNQSWINCDELQQIDLTKW